MDQKLPEISDRDLGLAALHDRTLPGVVRSHREIAAWCGCTVGNVYFMERRAKRMFRAKVMDRHDPLLNEFVATLFRK